MANFPFDQPISFNDALNAARSGIAEHEKTRSRTSLYSIIHQCNHIVDWYFKHLGIKKKPGESKAFREAYPEWDLLRRASNRLKHADPAKPDDDDAIYLEWSLEGLEWEDRDFWKGRASIKGKHVAVMCREFLDALDADVASGKAERIARGLSESKI